METTLKRITATALSIGTTLMFVAPAFAQTNVNPCDKMTPPWNTLCLVKTENIGGAIGNLILILFIAAALIALVFLIWGGIKWILSGGDKGKVETARATIIAAVIGLVVTFLSFFVLQLILGIFGIDITNLQIPKLFS